MKVVRKKTGRRRSTKAHLVEITVGRRPKDGSNQKVYRWLNVAGEIGKDGVTVKFGVRADNARQSERTETLARVHEQHPWIARLPVERVARAQRVMLSIEYVASVLVLCMPKRIVDEEIGDACEVIVEHFRRSPAPSPVYVKLVTTVFWVLIHAIGHFVSQARGSSKSSGEK
ncbi:hypothetical protein WME89_40945 [Sorangium sp. So ce321]|uniref:hypothetical protein n=1 Tax=Sorangium sp. So ce321 TaxID=3133300 RepID=UPI003F646E40